MDGPDVHLGQAGHLTELLPATGMNPLLQFSCGLVGEGEGDDGAGGTSNTALRGGAQQGNDTLRYDLGLARPRARDQLQIPGDVVNRLLLGGCETHGQEALLVMRQPTA